MLSVQGTVLCALSCFYLVHAQIDNLQESLAWESPKELKKLYPYFVSGFDNDGTPVTVMEYGHWDLKATMEKGPDSQEVKDLAIYTQQMFNRWVESPNILKTRKKDYCVIVDLDGYDNRQFTHAASVAKTLDMARQFVAANAKGIEYFKKMYLVNSNYLFQSLWSLLKPILGHLSNKMELHGTNKEKWIPLIRKAIPKDQIPEWLGGVATHKPIKVYG